MSEGVDKGSRGIFSSDNIAGQITNQILIRASEFITLMIA